MTVLDKNILKYTKKDLKFQVFCIILHQIIIILLTNRNQKYLPLFLTYSIFAAPAPMLHGAKMYGWTWELSHT